MKILVDTPQLWNTIDVYLESRHTSDGVLNFPGLHLLSTSLDRCKEVPAVVGIYNKQHRWLPPDEEAQRTREIAITLARKIHIVKAIYVKVNSAKTLEEFVSYLPSPCPILEAVWFTTYRNGEHPAHLPGPLAEDVLGRPLAENFEAPVLASMTVLSRAIHRDSFTTWTSLVHLTVCRLSLHRDTGGETHLTVLIRAVAKLQNLKHIHLKGDRERNPGDDDPNSPQRFLLHRSFQVCVLRSVDTLVLEHLSAMASNVALRTIRGPSLRNIKLIDIDFHGAWLHSWTHLESEANFPALTRYSFDRVCHSLIVLLVCIMQRCEALGLRDIGKCNCDFCLVCTWNLAVILSTRDRNRVLPCQNLKVLALSGENPPGLTIGSRQYHLAGLVAFRNLHLVRATTLETLVYEGFEDVPEHALGFYRRNVQNFAFSRIDI
ncbi:hypothetical protein NLI96_g10827 [Meripilus lineatus]|uniref:Uncharacterized protein n=1 Tax=Meripilus lineatus TaxID=2056292 RepID=A0AAD5UXF6_9APHY|nr:hypothetical protein NLI96_g10827 [Physisporinus lineatus]